MSTISNFVWSTERAYLLLSFATSTSTATSLVPSIESESLSEMAGSSICKTRTLYPPQVAFVPIGGQSGSSPSSLTTEADADSPARPTDRVFLYRGSILTRAGMASSGILKNT